MELIFDTYFSLLDKNQINDIADCAALIPYKTDSFEKEIYELSAKKTFVDVNTAYVDWLNVGRKLGLEYAPNKNTILKIVLKVKDEPELIELWIKYHAAIVGYHNLIILDTGSSDEKHLEVLELYKDKLIILKYDQYYDFIHNPNRNKHFYHLIAENCKYVTVLDADEFLIHYDGFKFSKFNVVQHLFESELRIHCGIWLNNLSLPDLSHIDISQVAFSLNSTALRKGLIDGKTIIKASEIFNVKHIGHNLHVREVIERIEGASMGNFFVFHLSILNPGIRRKRIEKHLKERGVLSKTISEPKIIYEELFKRVLELKGSDLVYANSYLAADIPQTLDEPNFKTWLLCINKSEEKAKVFSSYIKNIDFEEIFKSVKKLKIS